MKKTLSALLVLSLVLHYPSLSAEESTGSVFSSHSSLPISKVRTFWFIPNTQTGTMAYTHSCDLDCVDNNSEFHYWNDDSSWEEDIVSVMPDINVIVYKHGSFSYWIGYSNRKYESN